MKRTITLAVLVILTLKVYGQSGKQFIFKQTDKISIPGVGALVEKFTPTIEQIRIADSLSQIHIEHNRNEYLWTKEISDYNSYYRQYVGWLNDKKEKIIFVNSFCRAADNWTHDIVSYAGGGSCYFEIKVNLDRKESFDFHVNAPK